MQKFTQLHALFPPFHWSSLTYFGSVMNVSLHMSRFEHTYDHGHRMSGNALL
jgi:hypothetical protein